MPKLQAAQLQSRGVPASAISIIPDEQEAIEAALNMGQPGDLLLVASGGAVGSTLRYLVSQSAPLLLPAAVFPLGTLVVNITGSLLIGLFAGLAEYRQMFGPGARLLLVGLTRPALFERRPEWGAGTRLELFTRTGNSALPDSTWSDWSPAYVSPGGTDVVSPPARFVQWKAHLSRQTRGATPLLESVSLAYLPANLPPEVRKVEVYPPGVVLQKTPLPSEADAAETAFSRPPVPPEGTEFASPFPPIPGKKIFQKGMRSLGWEASDPNSDTLRFDLLYRGEGEQEWKPLAKGIREGYFAWDSTRMPDGRYRIRVQASDAPSNPPGSASAVSAWPISW